jgi:hypothetical protein
MSVVREEFGPTLPELLAPRVRALPRAAQVALAVPRRSSSRWSRCSCAGEADNAPQAVVRGRSPTT